MIQRDISQRKITDISSAKAAIALKESKIKELRQYTTRVPVNVRSQSNPYRTFNIPYTATSRAKPKARRPKPQRRAPVKSSVQSKMMAQRNRLQQSQQARAPRKSISTVTKRRSKLVPANKMRMVRRLRQQRAQKRFRARRAMGPTRSKGNPKAKAIDRARSKPMRRTNMRTNRRANMALSKDRNSSQQKSVSNRQKAFIAQQQRLRTNRARRTQETRSVRDQARGKAQRASRRVAKSRAVKAASKSSIGRRLSRVRSKKSRVANKRKRAKGRTQRLRSRLRFGQANLGSIRRNEGLGQAMVDLQQELSQAQHEENQLTALFGQLAKEEATLVQQLYAEEDDFAGTAPRHARITREPQSSSGRSFYDNREFNTYASRLASDSGGVPTPAYKELIRNYNNNITNGQFKSLRQALLSFTQQVASKRGEYFTRVVTSKEKVQARQLGILTVQKNRRAKSTPHVRTITARQRALYEQQRVAEDARSKAADKSAKVEQQLAGVFPRTRSAMERMTR